MPLHPPVIWKNLEATRLEFSFEKPDWAPEYDNGCLRNIIIRIDLYTFATVAKLLACHSSFCTSPDTISTSPAKILFFTSRFFNLSPFPLVAVLEIVVPIIG